MHGKTTKLSPPELPGRKRKSWLKLLGVTFQEDATNWDIRPYRQLICHPKPAVEYTFLGYANPMDVLKDHFNYLFSHNSLVMSVFLYGIEVWGAAYQRKYLDRIDRFLKRAYRFLKRAYRFDFTTKNRKTTILG